MTISVTTARSIHSGSGSTGPFNIGFYYAAAAEVIVTKTVTSTGVETLLTTSGAVVEFASTSQTAMIENRRYIWITPPGNFSFGSVTVERNSRVRFRRVTSSLVLDVAAAATRGLETAIDRPVRPPRPHAPTDAEAAAHAVFVAKLDGAIWLK